VAVAAEPYLHHRTEFRGTSRAVSNFHIFFAWLESDYNRLDQQIPHVHLVFIFRIRCLSIAVVPPKPGIISALRHATYIFREAKKRMDIVASNSCKATCS
jgi:hypothetical protein